MTSTESTEVLVIGSGFGGAIAAYHLAAGGAKVTVLERGPWLTGEDFAHDFKLGTYTRIFDFVVGDGMSLLSGNCVGGGSVVYFAAMPRAPRFVFERHGSKTIFVARIDSHDPNVAAVRPDDLPIAELLRIAVNIAVSSQS